MKTKYILPIFFASVASLSANATEISSDTNAAGIPDISTAETVFGADNLTLTVSDDTEFYKFGKSSSVTTATIIIADGKTLTREWWTEETKSNDTVSFNGATLNIGNAENKTGTFKLDAYEMVDKVTNGVTTQVKTNKEVYLRGNINIYTNFESVSTLSLQASSGSTSTMNIYNTATIAGYSGQDNTTVKIKAGTTTITGNYAQWGKNSVTNVESGTVFNSSALRIMTTSGGEDFSKTMELNIAGTVNVSKTMGMGGYKDNTAIGKSASIFAAKLNVLSGGTLNVTYVASNDTNRVVIADSLSNAGTISLTGNLYMSDNTTLTLKSGSTLTTEGKASQKESYINVVDLIYIAKSDNKSATAYTRPTVIDFNETNINSGDVTTASVTANIEGAQQLGGFRLFETSTLTLNFAEGSSLEIGSFQTLALETGMASDFTINITGEWGYEMFRVVDMEESDFKNLNITYNGEAANYVLSDADGGGFWVNNAAAVPEPAEWAMLFGSVALLFAIYRRQKREERV